MTESDFLIASKPRIIEKWIQRVRAEVPAARGAPQDDLVNNMPDYLDAIAELLKPPREEREFPLLIHSCKMHAQHRLTMESYRLEDVMNEHQILRQVIYDELGGMGPIDSKVSRIISFTIFRGMREAASAFTNVYIEQLSKSIESLKAERDLREQFVVALSHDLRQPLTAARMNANLLARDPGREDRFRFLAKIVDHIDRADTMIEDLLSASRISAGQKLPISIQECDLRDVVLSVVEELGTTYGDRFICVCNPPLRGEWDAAKLRRAIENLGVNAIKYGSKHTPVEITTRDVDSTVQIAVHNQGNPLSADEQKLLFKRFYRSNAAQQTGEKGWGLGLTLVRGIAEAHGGSITVESSAAAGTTFTITLPKHPALKALPENQG